MPLLRAVMYRVGDAWVPTGFRYQYRLCPATEPLTEACFQQMPLQFVGQSQIRRVVFWVVVVFSENHCLLCVLAFGRGRAFGDWAKLVPSTLQGVLCGCREDRASTGVVRLWR